MGFKGLDLKNFNVKNVYESDFAAIVHGLFASMIEQAGAAKQTRLTAVALGDALHHDEGGKPCADPSKVRLAVAYVDPTRCEFNVYYGNTQVLDLVRNVFRKNELVASWGASSLCDFPMDTVVSRFLNRPLSAFGTDTALLSFIVTMCLDKLGGYPPDGGRIILDKAAMDAGAIPFYSGFKYVGSFPFSAINSIRDLIRDSSEEEKAEMTTMFRKISVKDLMRGEVKINEVKTTKKTTNG
jgi:hypothetical protein